MTTNMVSLASLCGTYYYTPPKKKDNKKETKKEIKVEAITHAAKSNQMHFDVFC